MLLEVIIILLLILANGVLAMIEIALVSVRKTSLQQRFQQGQKSAGVALKLIESPNHFLSTIQVGITLIGIIAGAFGGATLATHLADYLANVAWIAPYEHGVALTIVIGTITYLSLVIGEIVPKRLALNHAETIACITAPLMKTLSTLANPIVKLLTFSTDLVLKFLGSRARVSTAITEEEVKLLVDEGTAQGVFEPSEKDIIGRVLKLGDTPVSRVMTLRSDIVWYDLEATPTENWRQIGPSDHAYFPVCRGSLDNVLGIGSVKELWFQTVGDRNQNIEESLSKPLFVPVNLPILKVLELFKSAGQHNALVIDEYGSVKGIVTFMDLLQAMVGDVPSAEDTPEPSVIQRDDGSWLVDGMLSLNDFKAAFNITIALPQEDTGVFHTLAGFMIAYLKEVPRVGQHFIWDQWQFEVVDMDEHRIDKVLIKKV